MMKVLVTGSGGREHTLCWKIAQSERVDKVYAAPGNGGISKIAECVDIAATDTDSLVEFAKSKRIDLTLVGPEAPLVEGIVDIFNEQALKIFGPDKIAAQLEGSKAFAKEKMKAFGIPSADFRIFEDAESAKDHVRQSRFPLVIKADGLAAGKGVIIAKTEEEAILAVDDMMINKKFGTAGDRIVVEDCLLGEEASIILITDGKDFVTLPSSQDHKRIFDNDKGPNTGGMGAYSPAPIVTDQMQGDIDNNIIRPLINGLAGQGTPYRGVLYVGLMITEAGPYVLEFNVRFGDPETQVTLPRLKTDLMDLIEASIDGNIKDHNIDIDTRACVCIVCASEGYPGSYKKNIPMNGLDEAEKIDDVVVFHAGTRLSPNVPHPTPAPNPSKASRLGSYVTNGGRVLGVTALGDDIATAIDKAYKACSVIKFEGIYYRRDIGHRALVG